MSVFMEGVGSIRTMVNGKLVEEKEIKGHYNGSKLEFSTHLNRPMQNIKVNKSYSLNNDDIMKLLSKPSSKLSLEDRIVKDYKLKHKKTNRKSSTRKNKKTKNNRKL